MPFKTTEAKRQYDRERYEERRAIIRQQQTLRRTRLALQRDVDNGYRRGRRDAARKLVDLFKDTGLMSMMNPEERAELQRLTK